MSTKTKTTKTKSKKENLAALGLPALWERFKEATGQTTKSPNKNYAERADMRSRLGLSRKVSCICAPDTALLDTERSA
jgi:hypothetical protein